MGLRGQILECGYLFGRTNETHFYQWNEKALGGTEFDIPLLAHSSGDGSEVGWGRVHSTQCRYY